MNKELKDILDRALQTDPSQIGHFIQGGFMDPAIKPIDDDMRVIGPAFTLRIPRMDNSMYYHAMQFVPVGSVIVVDRMGERTIANIGEMAVRSAKAAGAVGIVVDGLNTDTRAIREMGFPVFSRGRSAATNSLRGTEGQYGITINCGGAVVNPGDIVYGDLDGVVVAPAAILAELVEKAIKQDQNEAEFRKAFAEGKKIQDLMNIEQLVNANVNAKISALLNFD